jgi:hypothetical protein
MHAVNSHPRTAVSGALTVVVGVTAMLLFAPDAYASVGVGIQANPVVLGRVAHPGASYALPPLYVVNTGSAAESISIRVERLHPAASGDPVPDSWIQVTAPGGQLAPGQSTQIPLELVTPAGARPGNYASDIVVTGSATVAADDVDFGAAAATGLEFRITPAPPSGLPAWKLWTAGVLILLAAIYILIRRSGLRLRLERINPYPGGPRGT